MPPAAIVKPEGAGKPAGSNRRSGGAASLRSADAAAADPERSPAADGGEQQDEDEDRVDDGIVTNLRPHYSYVSGLRCTHSPSLVSR